MLKKILMTLTILSLMVGSVMAAGFPTVTDGVSQWSVKYQFKNNTSSTIDKGSMCYQDTANMGSYFYITDVVSAADTNAGRYFVGIADENIVAGQLGYVVVYGFAEVDIAASQADTTTAGGLILSATTGNNDEATATNPTAGLSTILFPFGYTCEAIASNAAATITCFIRPSK